MVLSVNGIGREGAAWALKAPSGTLTSCVILRRSVSLHSSVSFPVKEGFMITSIKDMAE